MTKEHSPQRYRVLERLASGGMAEVFLAESAGIEGFKKLVAIKRVLPHLSQKKRFIAMFLDEARLAAHLSHSNVVQVFDIGVGDQTYFIVMEYVDGSDLKGVIKYQKDLNRPFPIEAAIYITTRICEGLSYAHERTGTGDEPLNLVHRDISPPNVLISKHGEVKIVDFGLAKASTQLEKSEAGIIKGKFSYLSPEAAEGKEVDRRADVFAVGIMLWEMLAGRRLFVGASDYETVKLVQRAEVPPISSINPGAGKPLDSILARALARDADKRYDSARMLGQDLTRYLFKLGKPVSAFDIAELVHGVMQNRKRPEGEGVSIIDKLISETLFEFTSLTDDDRNKGAKAGEAKLPLSLGALDDFSGWRDGGAKRDGGKGGDDVMRGALASLEDGNLAALEDGNLAALEDEPTPGRPSGERISVTAGDGRVSAVPASGSGAGARETGGELGQPSSRTPASYTPSEPLAKKGLSSTVKVLIVLCLAAAAAAVVILSGVFKSAP
ncbi:MAG: serine/threonine protein kinase [Polyangiaceae bacterium]|nr:serine/threonine protein kinase [Polyangiaceae bacterium]